VTAGTANGERAHDGVLHRRCSLKGNLWQQKSAGKPVGHDWLPLILFLFGLGTHFAYLSVTPPGVYGDSARLGLHAFDFVQRKIWPFYIYHQFAPNPLIVYLQALAFTIFGFTPSALSGVTAFWGALAVPAIYLACRELFAGEGEQLARRAGFVAAVGLGLCPFFGNYSRYGIEGVLLVAIELLAVASLWRGLRRGHWYDFCLCGLLVGLSQYAYIVGRVFPVALAAACVVAALASRQLLARWRELMLAAISAAVVALPQWLLFVQAPYTLVARTQGNLQPFVLGLPNAGSVLGAKWISQLRMLGWQWSTGYHPYSNRPLLTPLLFVGLVVAVGVTLVRRRAGQAFSLSLGVLLLLPDLLFYEGPSPSATRVIPALPFVFVLAGLGCALIWRWLETRPVLPAWTGLLVPIAVLLMGAESQWHFATQVLPQVKATPGLEWKASLVELAEADYIAAHLDSALLLPSSEYQRAPLAFLLAEYLPHRASGLPIPLAPGETLTVVMPAEPERATTEGLPANYRSDEWILLEDGVAYFLPPVPNGVEPVGNAQPLYASNGALAAKVFPARWQGVSPVIQPFDASFANGLDLVGYQASELAAGQPLTITLYWRPRHAVQADAQMVVQLLDRDGQKRAAIHDWPLREAYRVRAWATNETIPTSYRFDIPSDLPPGPYRLIAGPYDLIHQRRIPLLGGQGYPTVATLKIPLPPSAAMPDQVVQADFGQIIDLTGYTLSPIRDGLHVTLFWEAKDVIQADYTVFIHLLDAGGEIAGQADAQPLGGQYPTSIWSLDERVVDEHSVSAPPGEYEVYVGLYQWETLTRLAVTQQGKRLPGDRLLLGVIKVP